MTSDLSEQSVADMADYLHRTQISRFVRHKIEEAWSMREMRRQRAARLQLMDSIALNSRPRIRDDPV